MPVVDKDAATVSNVPADEQGLCFSCSFGLDDDGNYAVRGVGSSDGVPAGELLRLVCDDEAGVQAHLDIDTLTALVLSLLTKNGAGEVTHIAGCPIACMCDNSGPPVEPPDCTIDATQALWSGPIGYALLPDATAGCFNGSNVNSFTNTFDLAATGCAPENNSLIGGLPSTGVVAVPFTADGTSTPVISFEACSEGTNSFAAHIVDGTGNYVVTNEANTLQNGGSCPDYNAHSTAFDGTSVVLTPSAVPAAGTYYLILSVFDAKIGAATDDKICNLELNCI